jgi:hypothetical protein
MFNRRNFLKFIGISGLFGITAKQATAEPLSVTGVGIRKNEQITIYGGSPVPGNECSQYITDIFNVNFNDGTFAEYWVDPQGLGHVGGSSRWKSDTDPEIKIMELKYDLAIEFMGEYGKVFGLEMPNA